MKRYISPNEEIITLHLKQMMANSPTASQTAQGVHTDDPQPPSNALAIEHKSVWDDEW